MKTNNRLKRPRGVYINKRDLDVLETLWYYQSLRERTLRRFHFPSIQHRRHIHRPLYRLVQTGYLKRRLPPRIHRESNDFFFPERLDTAYYITPKGADLLCHEGRIDEANPERLGQIDRLTSQMLALFHHDLDVRDIRACLDLALQNTKDIVLLDWCDENDQEDGKRILKTKVSLQYQTGKTKSITHMPDACFTLQQRKTGSEKIFFVEVDLGTESGARRWRDKVMAYLAYQKQAFRLHFPEYQENNFAVLTITRSRGGVNQEMRLDTLIAQTLHTGGRGQFYFTTFRQIMPDNFVTGDYFLTKPVWQQATPGAWVPPKERKKSGRKNLLRTLCEAFG